MGVTGNALDYAYVSHSNLPDVLTSFAEACVAAAEMSPKSCPLASPSMGTSEPSTDIVQRVNNILSALASNGPYHSSELEHTYTFANTANEIYNDLQLPERWAGLATSLLQRETTINTQNSSGHVERDIAFSATDQDNPFSGRENVFVASAIMYLDSSYANISDVNSFVGYLSKQAQINSLIAYQGLTAAAGLGWPNLTAYNVQKFTGPFPSQIGNKILVIAETNDPLHSMKSSLNTYEFLGPDNAVLLIHDGFGYKVEIDPNNCTTGAIKAYFANGMPLLFAKLIFRYPATKWDRMSK
jgi:hypothetical protein